MVKRGEEGWGMGEKGQGGQSSGDGWQLAFSSYHSVVYTDVK